MCGGADESLPRVCSELTSGATVLAPVAGNLAEAAHRSVAVSAPDVSPSRVADSQVVQGLAVVQESAWA